MLEDLKYYPPENSSIQDNLSRNKEELEKEIQDRMTRKKEEEHNEKCVKNLMNATVLIVTFLLGLIVIVLLTGCQCIPEITKAVDNIATDDAITIKCDRDCFQKKTNVKINVDIDNTQNVTTPE